MTSFCWRSLLLSALLFVVSGRSASPVRAQSLVVPVALSAGLTVHGIPLPQGAKPFLAANLSFKNLRAVAPSAGELGSGWVRAVVYDIPPPAPPDGVAAYYQDSMPGSAILPRQALERTRTLAADKDTRVLLLLQRPPRYLAIRAHDGTGLARITVAMYEGSAAPDAVLNAMEFISDNRDGPRDPTELLSPKKELWETDTTFLGEGLQSLKQHMGPGNASDSVIGALRSLLDQAQSVRLRQYRAPQIVSAGDALRACMQEARANRWGLWSIEAETDRSVSALYRLPGDSGMVWLRTGQGQATRAAQKFGNVAPTTEISRLEVTGAINLWQLLRPAQGRLSPTSPSLAVPNGRGGLGPPPRSPFSAQPRH
jgi:hypothetical protein